MTTDTVHITLTDAQRVVAEVVQEAGTDFVYEPPNTDTGGSVCVYYHDGHPSCLIGKVLVKLGVPLHLAIEANHCQNNDGIEIAMDKLRATGYVTWEDLVPQYFAAVQDAQDRGDTWGGAQRDGDRYLADPGDDE